MIPFIYAPFDAPASPRERRVMRLLWGASGRSNHRRPFGKLASVPAHICAKHMPNQKIVISINASWNIVNFRRGLIRGLQAAGYDVVALAPPDEYSARLAELGVEFQPIEIDNQGVSPIRDARLLVRYHRALRRIRPVAFLGYTAKPNVYGSLAAGLLGIPVINNVSGLGTAFIKEGLLTRIVSGLYRLAFRRSATVFFQIAKTWRCSSPRGSFGRSRPSCCPGSGINLGEFSPLRPGASRALRLCSC
jgi:hypothetical protein